MSTLTKGAARDLYRPGLSRRAWLTGMLMLPAVSVRSQATEVVVIVHPENVHAVDRNYVQRLFTGVLRAWPDGSPAFALDLPDEHATRAAFSQQWLGRSVSNVRSLWTQNVFTGKGLPPRITQVEGEMRRLVGTNRNAIGYLPLTLADSSVRVIRL
jgi:ABC-type phosphate transport system substrate-binding protein